MFQTPPPRVDALTEPTQHRTNTDTIDYIEGSNDRKHETLEATSRAARGSGFQGPFSDADEGGLTRRSLSERRGNSN